MDELKYRPVPHNQEAFLKKARKRKGFQEAYDQLGDEYALVRELLAARSRAGLTQDAVAERMGTTKSAVSRLEAAGKHSPSVSTLKKYAQAVGCEVEIRLVPAARSPMRPTTRKRVASSG
ncbi:MAG TPA: helix-turn-helix transcriptional regulator [Thermoanaerobaculia bacterium]|nr:helix-turn-helix transcriptional regulator [Thermoanaerobaculia bacterium]